ncbi:MAG TPA: mechanosensitive ion channel [Ferruginibacter sp.]|nr:mechanosensitive ion channel [Bacteroidota bacterium]MBS1926759.1 mechanosensitive ion channel [Bacteroidota bacterium]MCC6691971.1 mechanosensitive ion channel [Chitinophagaceae bacterium]HMT95996.1 mechanosensitive ion channel [Ferruginibacter sp.]
MDFLNQYFLDNTIKSYLLVLGIIVLLYLFKKFVSQSIANILYYPVKLFWKDINRKQFVSLLLKPLGWFILVCVALFTISRLNYPQFLDFKIYKFSFDKILEKTAVLIFVFSFIRLCLSIVDFISLILTKKASLTLSRSDDQMVVFFQNLLKAFIIILGILLALKIGFNQDISYLLTSLSIVGAAVALSAKESLENLIASFIIFLDKPFYVGDVVKVNAITGVVETIGLRSTRIRTTDKTLVTVPNKQMVDSVVDNLSFRTGRRVEMKLELSEKTVAETAQKLTGKIQNLITSQFANDITSATAFISDFNKNGITIIVEYFTPNISIPEFNTLRQNISAALIQLINDEQIQFAVSSNSITIVPGGNDNLPSNKPII